MSNETDRLFVDDDGDWAQRIPRTPSAAAENGRQIARVVIDAKYLDVMVRAQKGEVIGMCEEMTRVAAKIRNQNTPAIRAARRRYTRLYPILLVLLGVAIALAVRGSG